MITIYHNPRCSKSRLGLQFLTEKGINPNVVEYLDVPFTEKSLKELINKLQIKPIDLIRKQEDDFKPYKGKNMSDDELISLMVKYPKLIERPIVVNGNKAVIARPTENICNIL